MKLKKLIMVMTLVVSIITLSACSSKKNEMSSVESIRIQTSNGSIYRYAPTSKIITNSKDKENILNQLNNISNHLSTASNKNKIVGATKTKITLFNSKKMIKSYTFNGTEFIVISNSDSTKYFKGDVQKITKLLNDIKYIK